MRAAYAIVFVLGCSTLDHLPGASHEQGGNTTGPSGRPTAGELAPTPLAFDLLPINSVRGEVSGYDSANDLCVRVIWDYSNHGETFGMHCNDFVPGFPYVHVGPGVCDASVQYSGNLDVVSASGCVDFAQLGGTSTNEVDATIDVSGGLFTGTITVKAP